MTESNKASQDTPAERFYVALGRVVFAFTQVEHALSAAIETALGDSDAAQAVVAGLGFQLLLDRFSVLYGDSTVAPGTIKELCTRLAELNDERNRQIHSTWGFGVDSGHPVRERVRIKRNQGIELSAVMVLPAELESLAKALADAAEAVWSARLQYLRQSKAAWRETVREAFGQ